MSPEPLSSRVSTSTAFALCARAAPSHPAHPGLLATCSAAPVGPEMRVARVKNGPEPAEHGLHLGGCLSCRDAPPAGLRPDFYLLPLYPVVTARRRTKNKSEGQPRTGDIPYHWRVEPGTRTAPILGHRVVRVRWYPARFLKFCRRHGGEPHLPATGPTLRSGAGLDLGGDGGGGMPPPVTLAALAELS